MLLRPSNHAQGTEHDDHNDFIHSLARTAGTRQMGVSIEAFLAVAGAASLAWALLPVFSVLGIRQDFADMAVRTPFAFKVVYASALVVGASVVARSVNSRTGSPSSFLIARATR